jgi:hypothetical protein
MTNKSPPSSQDTVSDSEVKKLFETIGTGNKARVTIYSSNGPYERLGILKSYNTTTRKFVITDEKSINEECDMNDLLEIIKI